MNRKIGALQLSGLIIGPILGSGIIFLPPKIHEVAGDFAILAWSIILLLSFFYARLFGALTLKYPGDSGPTIAVEKAFGHYIRNLHTLFFILAVCFGPIAVMTTAGHYLQILINNSMLSPRLLNLILLLVVYLIATRKISSVGKITFISSSTIVIILLAGSLFTIFNHKGMLTLHSDFQLQPFGYSLLLLFWALVGWETIGNYSMEVRDLNRTLPKAITISYLLTALVTLAVVIAFQLGTNKNSIAGLINPLFGQASVPVFSLVTIILCMTTVLLVIGAVTRLVSDQAKQHALPALLGYRNKKSVPVAAFMALFIIHLLVFGISDLGWLSFKDILAIANAFFLCNSLLGILAAVMVLESRAMKTVGVVLAVCFLVILLFSSIFILSAIAMITFGYTAMQIRKNVQIKRNIVFEGKMKERSNVL